MLSNQKAFLWTVEWEGRRKGCILKRDLGGFWGEEFSTSNPVRFKGVGKTTDGFAGFEGRGDSQIPSKW